jgi:hypothetical protein
MYILNSDYNPIYKNDSWYGFRLLRLPRYKWITELSLEKKVQSFCPSPCPSCIARFIISRLFKKFVRLWRNKRKMRVKELNYRQIHGRFKRLRIY